MNQEELNNKISEKAKKMTAEQIGNLVLNGIELMSTKQVLMDELNILRNELTQLKKKEEPNE